MSKIKYVLFLGLFFLIQSCSKKTFPSVLIDGQEYISVKSFGAKGDGKTDDHDALQRALDSGKDIYIPKGQYVLASKTTAQAILKIDQDGYPEKILCEPGATLVVSPQISRDHKSPTILRVVADKGSIIRCHIKGLTIEGNRDKHPLNTTGILFQERKGRHIEEVVLEDITVKNASGNGIMSYASYNDFSNIKTYNVGLHGIGFNNYFRKNYTKEAYIGGYISEEDDAYSIDFSGANDPNDDSVAIPGFGWRGEAKNIKSINSKRGIKTAGVWDLKLENVEIINSKNNGFFINIDAPGSNIDINNMTITNAQGNGMSLSGISHVVGKDITLVGCKKGLIIKRSTVEIDGLIIDGQNQNINSLRIANDATIKNFTIKNAAENDKYPVWIMGKNVTLENGIFENNDSPNEVIVHESAVNVELINLDFQPSSRRSKLKNGIVNIQKKGYTNIVGGDFSKLTGKKIIDKKKRIVAKKAKGL